MDTRDAEVEGGGYNYIPPAHACACRHGEATQVGTYLQECTRDRKLQWNTPDIHHGLYIYIFNIDCMVSVFSNLFLARVLGKLCYSYLGLQELCCLQKFQG